ncbi:MAG: EamA family transporter RarD [Actinomycetota bacterium]|nr:EamA family transporter RarD [Actinomycetota bacterium]
MSRSPSSGHHDAGHEPHHEQRTGIIVGFATYAVWGLLTIYWKQLHRFDAFELIGWRITTAAVVMAIVLTVTHRWTQVATVFRTPHLLGTVAVASLFLTINWTSYVWAVVHDHVLETALGYFIAPLGTVTVGVLVLHEQLRLAQKAAIALAIASVAVLTVSYGRVPYLAIAIAVSWTIYGYIKKQVPLTPVESMAAESFVLALPAVVLVAVLAGNTDSIPYSATTVQLAYTAGTGLATVVPLMLFAFAAKRVPLTIIGPMQYIVPSLNFLIGWLLYDEAMPTDRLIGFALVWAGLAVLTVDSTVRARRARLVTT